MDIVNRSQGLGSVEFLSGSLTEQSFPLNKQVIAIGRAPTNDIVVPDQSVSGQHAQLFNNGGQWFIKKISPTNTVTINYRQRVESNPVAINNDDTIHLGGTVYFRFHLTTAGAVAGQSASPDLPNSPTPQQSFGRPAYRILPLSLSSSARRFSCVL
jgi:predicted component of type VI protein secretion system